MIEYVRNNDPEAAGLPFSRAVRVGNVFYLSGQLGTLPGKMELMPGGIEAEAAQAMDNIGAILWWLG